MKKLKNSERLTVCINRMLIDFRIAQSIGKYFTKLIAQSLSASVKILAVIVLILVTNLTASSQSRAIELSKIDSLEIHRELYRTFRDSAYLYEKLKPIVSNLRVAYEFKSKENNELRLSNKAMRDSQDLQTQRYQKLQVQAQKGKKFQRWIGRAEGFGIGLAGILLIGVSTGIF